MTFPGDRGQARQEAEEEEDADDESPEGGVRAPLPGVPVDQYRRDEDDNDHDEHRHQDLDGAGERVLGRDERGEDGPILGRREK